MNVVIGKRKKKKRKKRLRKSYKPETEQKTIAKTVQIA